MNPKNASANMLGVTTAVSPDQGLLDQAHRVAMDFSCPLIPRGRHGLKAIFESYGLEEIFVVTKTGLVLHNREQSVFWHPGTAFLKLARPQNKPLDILRATAIEPGDQVLDCTLGFGADALVMSWAAGSEGKVVGLEYNSRLAYLTQEGLKHYKHKLDALTLAMAGIQVVVADHGTYLSALPDKAYDVVYFDPMFREGVTGAMAMGLWKSFAYNSPLDLEAWQEAKRVARKRVVVKERIGSGVFESLGIEEKIGGWRRGAVAYGYVSIE